MTRLDWEEISHITKVDPAKELPGDLGVLDATDLVMVGGSDAVTADNTADAIRAIRDAFPDMGVIQEPYRSEHVSRETVELADAVGLAAVFNGDRDHFVGKHLDHFAHLASKPDDVVGSSVPLVGDLVSSKARSAVADVADKMVGEGYVIQNLDSKAAKRTGVDGAFTPEEVAGAALAAESFYGFPVFYVEYSGTYGGPEDVAAAAEYLDETQLVYGGGIRSGEQSREILDAGADAIVVGDCFHDDPERYRETAL